MSSTRPAVAVAVLAWACPWSPCGWSPTPARGRRPPRTTSRWTSRSACPTRRRPLLVLSGTGGRRIGWLLLGIGCCGAGAALSSAVLVARTGSSPLVRVAESVESWIWVGGFVPLLTLVPLLYPDGRLPGPRWRPWVVTSAAGMVLLAVGSATYPGGVSEPLFLAGALTLAPSCVAGIAALVVRWRRAEGLVRRQVAVLAGHRWRAGRRHPAPAAAGLAGGRPDPGGRGRLGARWASASP